MMELNIRELKTDEYFGIFYNTHKRNDISMDEYIFCNELIRNSNIIDTCIESDTIYFLRYGFSDGEYRKSSNDIKTLLNDDIANELKFDFNFFNDYALEFNSCNSDSSCDIEEFILERLDVTAFINGREYEKALAYKEYWTFSGYTKFEDQYNYHYFIANNVDKLLAHILNVV